MSHEAISIYILRLEGGHYYVGKTNNVMQRYQEHLNGSGSAWTTRYPPVSLVKTIENAGPFDEDKTVKEFMSAYGIDKVRGGSYVMETLTEAHEVAVSDGDLDADTDDDGDEDGRPDTLDEKVAGRVVACAV